MYVQEFLKLFMYSKSASQAGLMIFVLDTAIGVGVWAPFIFGKSTALLFVSPFLLVLQCPG
jgi:hypothetical protein